MEPRMTVGYWLTISNESRRAIAQAFGLRASNATHVSDNVVVSDGFTDIDLSTLNVSALQQYLGTKEKDFFVLVDAVIQRLTKPIVPHTEPGGLDNPKEINDDTVQPEVAVTAPELPVEPTTNAKKTRATKGKASK